MLHADRGTFIVTIIMKHIKHDFRSKAWVQPFGWTKAKIQLFQNMVMLLIKLKGTTFLLSTHKACLGYEIRKVNIGGLAILKLILPIFNCPANVVCLYVCCKY